MRHAYAPLGLVHEIIVGEPDELAAIYTPEFLADCHPCADDVQEGWLFKDGVFSAPTPSEPEIVIPQSVTRAQAKIALHRAGLLSMIKDAVEADPELQIWFDDAITWERQNPHVVALGGQLLGDATAIDALFVEAAKIDA